MNTQAMARAKQLGVKIHKADSFGRYYLEDKDSGQMIGLVQRGRETGPRGGSVPTWNGWDIASNLVVDGYGGSLAVAVANVIHASRKVRAEEALAADVAVADARRDEEDAQLERALVFASFDVDNAADMARAAGQTELADKLAGIATTLRDALPGSFVPEGTCF